MAGQEMTDGQHAESARERVRRCLIRPLEAEGAVRPKGVTLAEHEAALVKLAERLAYLDEPMLVTLHEVVRGLMVGPLRREWPPFLVIWNQAVRLRPPPDDERHIMVTWLRSVEGPVARAGGYLVELHDWLRRFGRPPDAYSLTRIKAAAQEAARDREMITARIERGTATQADRAWLDGYLRQTAYCEALVAGGEERRAGQGVAA